MRRNYAKKRKIKRYSVLIAIVALIAYISVIYFEDFHKSEIAIAKINNEIILAQEIEVKISEIFQGKEGGQKPNIKDLPPEVIKAFAREIYLERKLVEKAKEESIDNILEIKTKIKNVKNKILIEGFINQKIKNEITEDLIKKKYVELSSDLEGQKEYLIWHIVVDSEKLADNIYRVYNETLPGKKPNKFSYLVKKYSIDKESAKNNGKLGYITQNNIIPEIADEISSFKRYGYTKPIKTQFGWHIVKVTDVRDAKIEPYEDIKSAIRKMMIKEITDSLYKSVFQDAKIDLLTEETSQDLNKTKNSSSELNKDRDTQILE